jgi:hypothetical protein
LSPQTPAGGGNAAAPQQLALTADDVAQWTDAAALRAALAAEATQLAATVAALTQQSRGVADDVARQ